MGVAFAVLRVVIAAVPPLALRVPGKPVAAVGALVVGAFYMLLTGAGVPMQRSFAMAALRRCASLLVFAGRTKALILSVFALHESATCCTCLRRCAS